MLVFVFGSTTFATATVLAVFMGGLALGSFIAGRKADEIRRPFLWYGILEGVIGVWALIAPFLFEAATPLYRIIWQNLHLEVWPFSIIRFLVALAILIVPTTCMGATLPLLAKFVTTSLEYVGERIGTLYAANTLGAVAGAAFAGLFLLPTVGLNKTTIIAAVINFVLIAIVFVTAKSLESKAGSSSASNIETPDKALSVEAGTAGGAPTFEDLAAGDVNGDVNKPASSPLQKKTMSAQAIATMVAFAASGAVAMVYEVGWTRTLLMVIGSSTYAFTLMLTSFLLGIFTGSLICARLIDKAKDPVAWLAVIQLLIGAASLFSMGRFNSIPYWNLQLNAAFPADPNMALAARFLIAASIMMPLTIFLGAVFPASVKACVRDLSVVGRSVGSLYSANTLGAIVGAFLAGFVLVPILGVEKSLIFVTVINLFIGVGLFYFVESIRQPVKIAVLLLALVSGSFLMLRPEIWDRELLVFAQSARRRLMQTNIFNSEEEWREMVYNHVKLRFYEDGASSTVGIMQSRSGTTSLVTNGHVDASDDRDMSTQVLLAAAPIAMSPQAKDVAVIGWGSGVTVGVARDMATGTVTAIELEPAVIKTSEYFNHVNGAPEKDPRVHAEINDGRNFLLATNQKFDVIISEPSNPWQAGVCNLFTQEYFKLCKERLVPTGVLGLWCQNAEVPPKNILGILCALRKEFQYCAVLRMDDWNIVCLASQSPIRVDDARIKDLMKNGKVQQDLKRAGISSTDDLISRFCMAPQDVDHLVANVAPNDDDTNRLEYDVGKIYENTRPILANNEMFSRLEPNLPSLLGTEAAPQQRAEMMCGIARQAQLRAQWNIAESWALGALKAVPDYAEAYRILGINKFQTNHAAEAYELWKKSLAAKPGYTETLQTVALTYIDDYREDARKLLHEILSSDPANKVARFRLAQSYGPLFVADIYVDVPDEDPAEVQKNLSYLMEDQEFLRTHKGALFLMAWANYKNAKYSEALRLTMTYCRGTNKPPCAGQLLAAIYEKLHQYPEAMSCWRQVLLDGADFVPQLVARAEQCYKEKKIQRAVALLRVALSVAPLYPQSLDLLSAISKSDPDARKLQDELKQLGSLSR